MKKTCRIFTFVLLGVATTAATGIICQIRRKNMMARLLDAANEGYETAHDIIYPDKSDINRPRDLKYGPYIPKYN